MIDRGRAFCEAQPLRYSLAGRLLVHYSFTQANRCIALSLICPDSERKTRLYSKLNGHEISAHLIQYRGYYTQKEARALSLSLHCKMGAELFPFGNTCLSSCHLILKVHTCINPPWVIFHFKVQKIIHLSNILILQKIIDLIVVPIVFSWESNAFPFSHKNAE